MDAFVLCATGMVGYVEKRWRTTPHSDEALAASGRFIHHGSACEEICICMQETVAVQVPSKLR
jgi:hypothetical protein